MAKFTLGITNDDPVDWEYAEPIWDDERIVASSSPPSSERSYHQLMKALCSTAVRRRRANMRDDSYGVHDHLWNMKIMSGEYASRRRNDKEDLLIRLMRGEDPAGEEKYGVVKCPAEAEGAGWGDDNDTFAKSIDPEDALDVDTLKEGTVVCVTYDYGSTTKFYMKVLEVKELEEEEDGGEEGNDEDEDHRVSDEDDEEEGGSEEEDEWGEETEHVPGIEYLTLAETSASELKAALESVPAYTLPKERQVDHYFPHASAAFTLRGIVGLATLGYSEDNSVEGCFCAMEDKPLRNDLLFCPGKGFDMDELLQVANEAWGKRYAKNNDLQRWICAAHDDEGYTKLRNQANRRNASIFRGSDHKVFRLSRDGKKSGFSFREAFPRTHSMLTCGKLRWFLYRRGVLRVVAGRGGGPDGRKVGADQVLKTWRCNFRTFHEMLCTVEASWVTGEGTEMTPETDLEGIDVPNPFWNDDGSATMLQLERAWKRGDINDVEYHERRLKEKKREQAATEKELAEKREEVVQMRAEIAQLQANIAEREGGESHGLDAKRAKTSR